MSQENVETMRHGYEQVAAVGQLLTVDTPDFVWDMSHFHGWPEQAVYEGVAAARAFNREWIAAWDDWELDVEALHDAGDKVVAFVRQRGRSRAAGLPVDMSFAQVWTFRDGTPCRMDMYSDRDEALKAVGLED